MRFEVHDSMTRSRRGVFVEAVKNAFLRSVVRSRIGFFLRKQNAFWTSWGLFLGEASRGSHLKVGTHVEPPEQG